MSVTAKVTRVARPLWCVGGKFGGRIMGVRMLAIYGLPVGAVAGGALIETIGFRATATLHALNGIALTLAIARWWRASLQQADVAANGR